MTTETKELKTDEGAKSAKELAGTRMPAGGLTRLQPKTFGELIQLSNILAASDIVPKDLRGKSANVLLVLMFGNEIGISAAQALQNVMVVNGRPSLWGDAVMGLVLASSVYEDSHDSFDPAKDGGTATFKAKRKGKDWVVRTFSMADAAKAKLDKKEGPWQDYPKRMLFHRARSWALRDSFADVLKGLRYYEEEIDAIDLQKTSEKEYAMPTEKVNANVAETSMPATPVGQVAQAPAAPAPDKKPEGEIMSFKVSSVATTDLNGEEAYVIKDTSDPVVRYYTDQTTYSNMAKVAKETGAELGGVYVERQAGKNKVRFILTLQVRV